MTVDGRLCFRTEQSTDARRGPAAVLDTVSHVITSLVASAGDVTAIGIACAGLIHPSTGAVVHAPNLGWRDVPIAAIVRARLGLPVTIDNDVRAAAWGEFRHGGHVDARSLLAIFVGTGIGAGAVLDGALWRGAGNGAGELGHTQVVLDGSPCPCGTRGCLELYASGAGLQRRLGAAMHDGVKTRLIEACGGDPAALTAPMVAAAARSGDELARGLWTDACRYLAFATANTVTVLNPDVLVLGGGVIESVPELFDAVATAVMTSTTVLARQSLRIERARLGDWSGVLGAAALAASTP